MPRWSPRFQVRKILSFVSRLKVLLERGKRPGSGYTCRCMFQAAKRSLLSQLVSDALFYKCVQCWDDQRGDPSMITEGNA